MRAGTILPFGFESPSSWLFLVSSSPITQRWNDIKAEPILKYEYYGFNSDQTAFETFYSQLQGIFGTGFLQQIPAMRIYRMRG